MYYQEDTFTGMGGIELYYQKWLPEQPLRGILVILHGLGGHGGMYGNIIKYIVPQGFGIYTMDLRGHGKSPGQRGYINNWDEYRQDIRLFFELIQHQNPGIPCFLLGHSMGGLIVLDFVLHYPELASSLNGLITLAPALSKSKVSPIKILLGKMLSRLYPRFSLSTGIDFSLAARDPEVVNAYRNDKLRHSLGTARFASEFFKTQDWVKDNINEINQLGIPFLMMLAGCDLVIFPEGNRQVFQKLNMTEKELREYPDSYHDMQDDFNYQEVLTDLLNWLEKWLDKKVEQVV